jgi:BlaI family penicillinase repressor
MKPQAGALSRRERQIMDAVYTRKAATVAEVLGDLPDPPSYSAIRATMRILEDKGFLRHAESEGRYVYQPTVPREKAARNVLRKFLSAYFDGSLEHAVAALLSVGRDGLEEEDYDHLIAMIQKAREEKK